MPPGYSNSKAHNDAQNAAEGARQLAVSSATSQAQLTSADIVYFKAVVRSGLINGVGVEPAMTALRNLGVTGL